MPILWRHLIIQFLKVLVFCMLGFVALLLTTRMDEIAQFATVAPSYSSIFLFILMQIPYIIPIALPISALISAYLLMQRLTSEQTLPAIRSCGISLGNILYPLFILGAALSLFNFYVSSELATQAHFTKSFLKKEIKAINPLSLFQQERFQALQGLSFVSLSPQESPNRLRDLIVSFYPPHGERLFLFLAEELENGEANLNAKGATFISNRKVEDKQTLLIENAAAMTLPRPDLSALMQQKIQNPPNDYLTMRMLLARQNVYRQQADKDKAFGRKWRQTQLEAVRRLSIGLSVFAFTLLGLAYGISIGRTPSARQLFTVLFLAGIYLVCYFAAKGVQSQWALGIVLYLLPFPLLCFFSSRRMNRLNQGRCG